MSNYQFNQSGGPSPSPTKRVTKEQPHIAQPSPPSKKIDVVFNPTPTSEYEMKNPVPPPKPQPVAQPPPSKPTSSSSPDPKNNYPDITEDAQIWVGVSMFLQYVE